MEEIEKDIITERYNKMTEAFVWTPMNTEKIKNLAVEINKKINCLYDKIQLLKMDFDSGAEKGVDIYREYIIEGSLICSPQVKIWDFDAEVQEKLIQRISRMQRNIYASHAKMEDRKSQMPETFGLFSAKELSDLPACSYVQVLFGLSKTYSPQDMLDMTIDDFKYHIEVFFDPN